jgi:hypothetical protein
MREQRPPGNVRMEGRGGIWHFQHERTHLDRSLKQSVDSLLFPQLTKFSLCERQIVASPSVFKLTDAESANGRHVIPHGKPHCWELHQGAKGE